MQNTGNINYSLNKTDFYNILINNTFAFVPFYIVLVVLSLAYLFNIKYSLLYHINSLNKYVKNEDLEHYFKSITYNSPFNIISLDSFNNNELIYNTTIENNLSIGYFTIK